VARRDLADSSRETSPLRQADDALALDTTGLSVDQVVEEIILCLKNTTSN
jgi:cytidylate kinase